MDTLKARDGLIQFLFADEDYYYLNSLLRLNLHKYVYYCLKQNGFQNIFFIRKNGNNYEVNMEDRGSFDRYPDTVRSATLGLFALSSSVRKQLPRLDNRNYYTAWHKNKSEVITCMGDLTGDGRRPSAFVIPIALFCELFHDEEQQDRLREILEKSSTDLILIQASCNAEESRKYLTGTDTVFAGSLFPEMTYVLRDEVFLFPGMAKEFGRRYHVWNQLSREDIRRMLQREYFFSTSGPRADPSYLDVYADILFLWFHNARFQQLFPGLFPGENDRRLSAMRDLLKREGTWQQMNSWITGIEARNLDVRKYLNTYLSDTECRKTWDPLMNEGSNSLYQRLRGILPGPLLDDGHLKDQVLERLRAAREGMLSARVLPFTEEAQSAVRFGIVGVEELVSGSFRNRDAWDQLSALMEYALCSTDCLESEEIYSSILSCRKMTAELALAIAKKDRIVQDYGDRIRECQSNMSKKIEEFRRKNPDYSYTSQFGSLASQGEITPQLLEKQQEMNEVIHLDRESKRLQALMAGEQQMIVSYQESQQQFETAATKLGNKNLAELPTLLGEIARLVEAKGAGDMRYQRQMEEAKIDMDATSREVEQMLNPQVDTLRSLREFDQIVTRNSSVEDLISEAESILSDDQPENHQTDTEHAQDELPGRRNEERGVNLV